METIMDDSIELDFNAMPTPDNSRFSESTWSTNNDNNNDNNNNESH